ncbi:unnamed protein product [Danaus chrysippus]|uniref:(African queen) hypothetical protein n=1 Tax=Danaus chrysippus TaxID=151541 RepID=A0A8J2W2N0_9NEOP|nr:unnamed protein product [Danaus chrysippus]
MYKSLSNHITTSCTCSSTPQQAPLAPCSSTLVIISNALSISYERGLRSSLDLTIDSLESSRLIGGEGRPYARRASGTEDGAHDAATSPSLPHTVCERQRLADERRATLLGTSKNQLSVYMKIINELGTVVQRTGSCNVLRRPTPSLWTLPTPRHDTLTLAATRDPLGPGRGSDGWRGDELGNLFRVIVYDARHLAAPRVTPDLTNWQRRPRDESGVRSENYSIT